MGSEGPEARCACARASPETPGSRVQSLAGPWGPGSRASLDPGVQGPGARPVDPCPGPKTGTVSGIFCCVAQPNASPVALEGWYMYTVLSRQYTRHTGSQPCKPSCFNPRCLPSADEAMLRSTRPRSACIQSSLRDSRGRVPTVRYAAARCCALGPACSTEGPEGTLAVDASVAALPAGASATLEAWRPGVATQHRQLLRDSVWISSCSSFCSFTPVARPAHPSHPIVIFTPVE